MLGILLAVNPSDAVLFSEGDQSGEGDLGSIGLQSKHRLAKYGFANRHAIQTAHQFTVYPRLHAVRETSTVQGLVGQNHVFQNPSAVLPFSFECRAMFDDVVKRFVKCDAGRGRFRKLLQGLTQ